MDLRALAADLGNAVGSGKTGALEIGGGVTAGITELQGRISAVAQKAGVALGRVGGTDFTTSLSAGAQKGSAVTTEQTQARALSLAGISPTKIYLGLAVAGLIVGWFLFRRK